MTTITETNLFAVADNIEQGMSLFRAGFKAEVYWGDVITAHHMNTRSVYRLKENSDVAITHTATYEGEDIFAVSITEVTAYHTNGNVLSSTTKTLGVYDNFNDAYYCAVDVSNGLKKD